MVMYQDLGGKEFNLERKNNRNFRTVHTLTIPANTIAAGANYVVPIPQSLINQVGHFDSWKVDNSRNPSAHFILYYEGNRVKGIPVASKAIENAAGQYFTNMTLYNNSAFAQLFEIIITVEKSEDS